MIDNYSVVINRVKRLCAQKGISQKELAEKLGISRTSLSLINTGKKPMSLNTLSKLCETLDTCPCCLTSGRDVEEPDEDIGEIISQMNQSEKEMLYRMLLGMYK